MAKLVQIHNHKEWEERDGEAVEDWLSRTDAMFDELERRSSLGGGIVGKVISFPHADGYAHYIVVKESPLTVASIPVGDRWQVSGIMIRGLRKADVEAMVRRDAAMKSLFKRKKP